MHMTEREPDFSRVERKKGRNRNKVLNSMIAVVVVLIIIATVAIFSGNKMIMNRAILKKLQMIALSMKIRLEDVEDDDKDNATEDSNPTTDEEKSAPENTTETDQVDETTNETIVRAWFGYIRSIRRRNHC